MKLEELGITLDIELTSHWGLGQQNGRIKCRIKSRLLRTIGRIEC